MKTALALPAGMAALAALCLGGGAVAQDYGAPLAIGAYGDGPDYDAPLPPRPVPGYGLGTTETVVTTTRRVVTAPGYGYGAAGAYGAPQTVVTTRRVVAPAPYPAAPLEVDDTGGLASVAYPPPRRVLRSEAVYPRAAVLPGERVVTRRLAPAPGIVIEERRVETTRRVLGPAPADWAE